MIKSILVPLVGDAGDGSVLEMAHSVANHFQAHIDALHVRKDPLQELAKLITGDGIITQVLWDALEEDAREHNDNAKRSFAKFCEAHDVHVLNAPHFGRGESASWLEVAGNLPAQLGARGRYHDLIVTGRDCLSAGELGDVLVRSGRPMLVCSKRKPPGPLFGTIAVAWKDTANSAHAMTTAMPFLHAAKQIVILSATEGQDNTSAMADADRIAVNFRWHGIEPEIRCLSSSDDIGQCLVDAAVRAGAGLLVMGGYSHSRAREFVLGGATRYMLEASDFPVLIVH